MIGGVAASTDYFSKGCEGGLEGCVEIMAGLLCYNLFCRLFFCVFRILWCPACFSPFRLLLAEQRIAKPWRLINVVITS